MKNNLYRYQTLLKDFLEMYTNMCSGELLGIAKESESIRKGVKRVHVQIVSGASTGVTICTDIT
jgi:ribosomal protein L7Ae-like RNA K-turn-binding protein